jgi:hypothetical protein
MSIVLVPIALFASVVAVILGTVWLATRRRIAALGLIKEAVAKGQTLDAALVDRLMPERQAAVGKWFAIICLLFGAPAFGVGSGLLVAANAVASGETASGLLVASSVNLSNGVALVSLGLVSLRLLTGVRAPRWDFATVLGLICLFLGACGVGVGIGLSIASQIYAQDEWRTGLLIGALVNGGSGGALAALGVFILRVFGDSFVGKRGS